MAVYVVDADAAIELARRGYTPGKNGSGENGSGKNELFAPTLLRSQVLARVRAEIASGRLADDGSLELAERACRLPRRLLGDAVLRRTAWMLADEHGWHDTYDAEYIALTQLHGEALIAGNNELAAKAAPIVPVETVESFLAGAGSRR